MYARDESDVGDSSDTYILRALEKEENILLILKLGECVRTNIHAYKYILCHIIVKGEFVVLILFFVFVCVHGDKCVCISKFVRV